MPVLGAKHFERFHLFNNRENRVNSKSTFYDLNVLGKHIVYYNNANATTNSVMSNTTSYFATNVLSVPANTKVGHIVIGVSDNEQIGTTIEGVNIGIVRKSNNTVLSHFMVNGTAIVQRNVFPELITCNNIIVVPINSSWNEEVYFMLGAKGAVWAAKTTGDNSPAMGGTSGMVSPGQTITLNPSGNWLGKAIVLGDIQSVSKAFNGINRTTRGVSITNYKGETTDIVTYMTADEVTAIKNLFVFN